jgi:mediator of RNA polymerase II transcription subunit 6
MNTQYIDITWLTTFGLRIDNVLEYFYTSPFYDPNCNNEIVRTQGLSSVHLQGVVGTEYAVDLQCSQPPHLFVIRKQERRSRTAVEALEVFYCLDGILYQCPVFLEVLQTRLAKASLALKQSLLTVKDVVGSSEELS